MARRRYYRSRRVYPKQKWLPVNNELGMNGLASLSGSNYVVTTQPITENSSRNITDGGGNVSSATIVKIGRVRIKGVIVSPDTTGIGMSYIIGIAYLPEGYNISQVPAGIDNLGNTFFYKHPEWIMCWTRTDYSNAGQANEFSLSSRLKRNLNTGDQIVVFRIAVNANTVTVLPVSSIRATISYVCRAN